MYKWNTLELPQLVVQQYNALYIYQVCCTTGMYQVPVVVTVVAHYLLMLCIGAALYDCCCCCRCCFCCSVLLLYYQKGRGTTTVNRGRTPYYPLRRPLLDCALSIHIHTPWVVVLNVLQLWPYFRLHRIYVRREILYVCINVFILAHRHFFSLRPRVFARAIGSAARREPTRTPHASWGHGRGPWHVLWGFKVASPLGEGFRARRTIQAHANPRAV